MKSYTVSDFKARCLQLIERVRESDEPIVITKRGRVVARVVPAGDDDDHPWHRLRGVATWTGDPLAPALADDEIDAQR